MLGGLIGGDPLGLFGGGGPLHTLIVVNDNDSDSLEVGRYYADARGIPDRQILHLTLPPNGFIDSLTFTNSVRQPILDYLSDSGLDPQISTVVFTWFTPYTVRFDGNNANGLTSAMYYGYKNAPVTPPCDLNAEALNPYWLTERSLEPGNIDGLRISSMITSDSLSQTFNLIDRSVLADHTRPSGNAYYLRTSDNSRNIRWPEFDEAQFMYRLQNAGVTQQWVDADFISGESNVVAYLTGDQIIPDITSNHYLPGALADHVTSFGGLLNPFPSQMSIKEWIHAGCVGSYGTITEPCGYTNKFPEAITHYYYARGFSMGESYMMGLQHPYQGLLLGDPLCQPFAAKIQVMASGLVPESTVRGTVTLDLSATSDEADRWLRRLDLFIDGQFWATVTNVAPAVGNTISTTINGNPRSITVGTNEDLEEITRRLRNRINQPPNIQSTAQAAHDRILLKQDALGVSGAGITYSASAGLGSASEQTVHAYAANTQFVETMARARQRLTLIGTAQPGYSITAAITRPDGPTFTHTITAEVGDSRTSMMSDLLFAVRNDPNLQGTNGCDALYILDVPSADYTELYLVARSEGWNGYNFNIDFDVVGSQLTNTQYDGPFATNQDTLSARGQVYISIGRPTLSTDYLLDTHALSDGPHTLSVVAYEGTAVATQGHTNIPFYVDNHDLEATIDGPIDGRSFLHGDIIEVPLLASATAGSVTSLVLFAEGKALPSGSITNPSPTTSVANASIDAAAFASGPLTIYVEARDTLGRHTRSDQLTIFLLQDTDGDQLEDAWEVENYGAIEIYGQNDDPDNDTFNNYYEYITDTHPTNPTSFFEFLIDANQLSFFASSNRWYNIQENPSPDLNTNAWQSVFPESIPGNGGVTNVPFGSSTHPVNRYRLRISR